MESISYNKDKLSKKMVGIKSRKECNIILNDIVNLFLSTCKDIRYIQGLWILNIIDSKDCNVVDRFSEEPYNTILRILPNIKSFINNLKDTNIEAKNIISKLKILGLWQS